MVLAGLTTRGKGARTPTAVAAAVIAKIREDLDRALAKGVNCESVVGTTEKCVT